MTSCIKSSWLKLIGTLTTVFAGAVILNNIPQAFVISGITFAFVQQSFMASLLYCINILFLSFNTASLTVFRFLFSGTHKHTYYAECLLGELKQCLTNSEAGYSCVYCRRGLQTLQ